MTAVGWSQPALCYLKWSPYLGLGRHAQQQLLSTTFLVEAVVDADVDSRARAIVDAWNHQVDQPIKDLRFPVLSIAAALTDVCAASIVAAEGASYRVDTIVRTERRKGAVAPNRIGVASNRAEAEERLPTFRPMPTRLDAASTIQESVEHVVDVETQTCDPCRGTGQVDCSICDGKREVACGPCHGSGQVLQQQTFTVTCPRCSGYGFLPAKCPTCDQRGTVRCTLCEDDGYVRTYQANADGSRTALTSRRCDACGTTTNRTCPTCEGRRLVNGAPCPTTVAVQREVSVNCPTCHASGKVDCTRCVARGRVECGTCDGFRQTHLCTIVRRGAVITPIQTWQGGANADLASTSWVDSQLESHPQGRSFEIRRAVNSTMGGDQFKEVRDNLPGGAATFVASLETGLKGMTGLHDAVVVNSMTVPSITFSVSVGDWNARFLQPQGGPTFASTGVAPTDPAQERLQEEAYVAWLPVQVKRLEAEYQAGLVDAASRRRSAEAGALRARPWHRIGLLTLCGYIAAIVAAWWIIVQVGVPLAPDFAGAPRRLDPTYGYLIVAFLGVMPAVLLRRRIARVVRLGVDAFRTFVPPPVADPERSEAPTAHAPRDWAPSEHEFQAARQTDEDVDSRRTLVGDAQGAVV